MTNLTNIPLQDDFETTLSSVWTGGTGVVNVNSTPSGTMPVGQFSYIVVDPGKINMQVAKIDSWVTNTSFNVSSISVAKGSGVNYTQQTHAAGAIVRFSNNYQFWKDILDAINSKADLSSAEFQTILRAPVYADATARDAGIPSPANGMLIYNTALGVLGQYVSGAWTDIAAGSTPNASTTVAGKVEIATTAQSVAGTDTGETGALMSVLPSDIAKNIQSSTFVYGADAGGDDTYVVALTPTLAAYTTGQKLQFRVTTANTGACSVNFGPSTLNVKTKDGNDPQSGVIRANMIISGHYDGTNFVLDAEDFATDTNKGIVELATNAEAVTGTSTTLATTPAGVLAAINNALYGGDYDFQYAINWINTSGSSVPNCNGVSNLSVSVNNVEDNMILDFTSDGYIYNLVRGKPGTANRYLRWDDITRAELEFYINVPSSVPSSNRYVEVGFADSSATTGWTNFNSVQNRAVIAAGNAISTSFLMRTADGATASSGGALTATVTNWNKIKIIYERGVSVKTYINGSLVETKTTNLPSGTNNIVVGAGIDSAGSEDMYLSGITVRVKYA